MKKIWIAFVFLSLFTVKGLAAEEIKEVVIFEKLSKKEKTILLGEHNRVRADIGVKALEWSDELSRYVEQWANYLAENLCVLRHRPSSGKWKRKYGENLFMCVAGPLGVIHAVNTWAHEKKNYRYGPIEEKNCP